MLFNAPIIYIVVGLKKLKEQKFSHRKVKLMYLLTFKFGKFYFNWN